MKLGSVFHDEGLAGVVTGFFHCVLFGHDFHYTKRCIWCHEPKDGKGKN